MPTVTYDDMTVRQALDLRFEPWASLTSREAETQLAAQRRLYDRSVAACAASDWCARSIVDDYGQPAERVFTVGIGGSEIVQSVPRDWSAPRYLFVGIDWHRKNGPSVLRSFGEVVRRFPSARLDLVGGHPDVSGLEGVRGHGVVDRTTPDGEELLRELFSKATCLVMPSFAEPAGMAYVEALAKGVPCIATTVGGALDLVGDAGVGVDPQSETEIREAMLRLSVPEVCAELGRRAMARGPLFTWPLVAERILSALFGTDVPARASLEASSSGGPPPGN